MANNCGKDGEEAEATRLKDLPALADSVRTSASGVGTTLRDARLRNDLELVELAKHLGIRRVHLAAIENGRFDQLPAGPYAANFVRAYAAALALDPDEMVRRFRNESGPVETWRDLRYPAPLKESRMSGQVAMLGLALLAVLAYGAWPEFAPYLSGFLARVAQVPEQVQASAPPLPPPPAPRAVEPVVPALATPVPSVAPVDFASSAAAAPTSEAMPAGPKQIEPSQGARVVISAHSESWLLVRDPAGNRIFEGVLKVGESYHVPNQPGLLMTTGSAGALEVMIDRRPGPSLGRVGAVRRDIPLDPERLAVLPPDLGPPRLAAPPASTAPQGN